MNFVGFLDEMAYLCTREILTTKKMLLNLSIIRRCLFVLLMTILPLTANGITGKLYEYDKLTNSLVTQLCQDKYGYVWIASDFGLNRFDGYHFVNYYYSSRDSLSIPHNLVRSLLCTKDGQMFIGTGKGLAQLYNYATMGDSPSIEALMDKDRRLTEHYNTGIANGKWNGMMLDNHIGYTKWSIPDKNYNPMTLGFKVEHDLSPKETSEYSIPAYKYNNKVDGKDAKWIFLPDLGRGEGCMGSDNVVAASDITGNGAALEYDIDLKTDMVAIGILPTQDIRPEPGLRLGVQIDNQPMKIIDARQGIVDTFGEYTSKNLAVSKVLKPLPAPNRLLLSSWYKGKRLPRRDEVFDNNHYSYFGAKEKK